MFTINGIGTTFNGIKGPDADGKCTATCWFSFLYLPVIPLWRAEIVREITDSRRFSYRVLQKTPLSGKEILSTYFFGWILIPLCGLLPGILLIREIAEQIGIVSEDSASTGLYDGLIATYIVYLIAYILLLVRWKDRRGLPSNFKEILKARTAAQKQRTS